MREDAVCLEVHDGVVRDTADIIEWLDLEDSWERSVVSAASPRVDEMRTSTSVFVPFFSYKLPECVTQANKAVFLLLDDYAIRNDFQFQFVEDVSVQRYEPGQSYKTHYDGNGMNRRVASAVLYLNDVEEGGETYFPRFDLAVQPKAGRVVVFPSTFVYEHEARPPVSGVKYAAAYWAVW